jgi:hypothetical protein
MSAALNQARLFETEQARHCDHGHVRLSDGWEELVCEAGARLDLSIVRLHLLDQAPRIWMNGTDHALECVRREDQSGRDGDRHEQTTDGRQPDGHEELIPANRRSPHRSGEG